MAKGRRYISSRPEQLPDWYWSGGLHDACILKAETFEFPFDYNKYAGKRNQYHRNLLALTIDAEGALGDTTVKEIRLFNYKILSGGISLENREKIWWLSDRLSDHGEYYVLEINLQDVDFYPEDFTVKIKFEKAEVVR